MTKKFIDFLSDKKTVTDLTKAIIEPFEKVLLNLSEAYIFGSAKMGDRVYKYLVSKNIKVLGFVDNDPKKRGLQRDGVNIFSLSELDPSKNSCIIIASSYLCDIGLQLKKNGFFNVIPYYLFGLYDERGFRPEVSFNNPHRDIILNKSKYISFYNDLADEKSKEIFDKVMMFRLTYDTSHLIGAYDSPDIEYFDSEIVKFENDENVFVDCGGYNGDTVQKFIDATRGEYKKIYYFEPLHELCEDAKKNLKNYRDIEFVECGVYSENKILRFESTGDLLAGAVSDDGNIEIKVVALDDYVKEPVTFIKLDVEGSEEEAIIGAKNHIKTTSPILTIASYHRAHDLWRLPEVLKSINPNYKFFLRHYSQSIIDTIIYAIPTDIRK
jgi:FkbM family methyltransferase